MWGQIKGKSKSKVYYKYKDLVDNRIFTDMYPDPKYKKHCKKIMYQDKSTSEWVLDYHLHT